METKQKNILAVTVYRIFSRMYFYLPILFPLFYLAGESVLKIEILLGIYGVAIVFLLKPAKMLTAKIGHKYALIMGELLKIVGLVGLSFLATSFFVAVVIQIIMGFGYAMIVGNDTVILQQTFIGNLSHEYQNIQAKTNSYMFLAVLVSGLLGALIFQYNIQWVLGLSVAAALVSLSSIICMTYIKYENKSRQGNRLKNQPAIDYPAQTYYFVIRGIVLAVFVGVLPYFLYILMKANMTSFAIIISSFTFAGFISSKYLTKYVKKIDLKLLFPGSLLIVLIALALLLFQELYLSFITSLLLGLVSGCIRPVTIAKINPTYDVEQTLNKAEFNYGVLNSTLLLVAGLFLQFLTFNNYIVCLILAVIFSMIFFSSSQLSRGEYV